MEAYVPKGKFAPTPHRSSPTLVKPVPAIKLLITGNTRLNVQVCSLCYATQPLLLFLLRHHTEGAI